ncbi:SIS domain-containing protein [Actinospongicola halichondriae]|uniref:SIS domain-containing protein n=1 Tax=Actinospongicola halichondriae TaxID=3236844 RepID=UPI003D5A3D38
MCGIIAVLRRPVDRVDLDSGPLADHLDRAVDALRDAVAEPAPGPMADAAESLEAVADALHGPRGVRFLLTDQVGAARVRGLVATLAGLIDDLDGALDALVVDDGTEARNAAAVRCKDAVWAIDRDRIGTADGVATLVGRDVGWSAVEACTQIEQALRAIDRLEVRGRDSAGLLVLVRDHDLDAGDAAVTGLLRGRADDELLRSGAVRVVDADGSPALAFAYKAAAEIGELGDNTAALRAAIGADGLLRLALSGERAQAVVLGHTRWASVGIISEANAHPLDSWESTRQDGPFVAAALNGDVDNFADLKAGNGLSIWPEITTDAKVIPTLVSRRLVAGDDHLEAFRASVASFEGSVAIAATAADRPNALMLALRGSGQALYVGLAGDAFVVASEPYGLVEETSRYLRMDGETPANPDNPNASRGQILLLDGDRAGTLEGIERIAYDGTPIPVSDDDVVTAEITTRDIDRGDFPHFLLKEVTESPVSFRKTLRGRLVGGDDGDDLRVVLPDDSLPSAIREALTSGSIRRILAIGQGTAHIASRGFVALVEDAADRHEVQVEAIPATELSGFRLRQDMSDTLIVAISQSGTTTDTNRTVDLVRSRGASVIAIVNRRGSDLTDRADGVLYTSDGRDVEMAVPSTKAFYAQIAAGYLLALAIAEQWGESPDQALLRAIRDLPEAMVETLTTRPAIAEAAHEWCPSRRYWAIVGNGTNRIAAEELRIKLSELCYKSIACDATEDKKHIDLSSEPLILVCAAGLTGSNVDDVAKEVAIYRAHKAAPIVIATEGEGRFASVLAVLHVPETHPMLAFVLATMVGHLFGYEAALAIDAQALPLKQVRAAIEEALEDGPREGEHVLASLRRASTEPVQRFFDGLRAQQYDGHLEASTAVRIANLLRYASGAVPLGAYQLDHGKVGTPSVLVEDLTAALTRGIDELTRPIDAIKHQAKTVTVGISRTDESLLEVPLVRSVLDAGAARDRLTYATLRTLADVSPAIDSVVGHTRYRIEGNLDIDGGATITVVDRSGIALDLPLRTEANPVLRGTKHQVATEQLVLVGRGRSDGRSIVIVPEVKDNETTGITLLHVQFVESLPASTARGVLAGYRRRLAAIRDAVTETEPSFRDDLLAEIPVVDLLTLPVGTLADRWRA